MTEDFGVIGIGEDRVVRKKAFVFDIDGTLALRGERSPYDRKRIGEDTVNVPVRECLRSLRAGGFSILLFSGRDAACKWGTVAWLARQGICHGTDFDLLLMRPAGSKVKDDLVKLRMLGLVQDEYEVVGVFEDRKRVKRMWVEAGVFVFDVNQRDEEF